MSSNQISSIAEHPLDYVSNDKKRAYRKRVILIALLCMGLSIALFCLDLFIFTLSDSQTSLTDGLRVAPDTSERSRRYSEGFSLMYIIIMFGALPYGVYKLATIKRQMSKLALKDLATSNSQLRQMLQKRKVHRQHKIQSSVSRLNDKATTIFLVLAISFVITVVILLVYASLA